MKTQLLEDFDESGSAPSRAAPPAAQPAAPAAQTPAQATVQTATTAAAQSPASADRPIASTRPAVWQRPRQTEAAEAAEAVPSPARVHAHTVTPPQAPVAVPPPNPPSPPPVQRPIHPRGFAPQPTATGTTTVPLGDTTAPAWPQGAPDGGDPDWLRERLARDAALQERTEWNGQWKRRLASWGAAGVLLALLAGGGLWLYEQSRVEGALVVVANTNPAPDAHTLRPVGVPASAAIAPAPAPLPPAAQQASPDGSGTGAVGGAAGPLTAAGADSATASGPDAAAAAGAADTQTPAFADRTVVPVATDVPPAAKSKHKRSRVSKPSEPEARADVREGERSYRQRYEETLMQCRAHGYDERQCLQRGCEMTRYGFACKG